MPGEEDANLYVRAEAQAQGWTAGGAIAGLGSLELIDPQFLEWCRLVKDELTPSLFRAMRQETGEARLQAALLLLHLGEADGTDGVLACLQEEEPRFRLRALSSLSMMPMWPLEGGSPTWAGLPVAVRQEALFSALEPLLAEPETQAGSSAVEIALKLDLPQAEQRVLPLLRTGAPRLRAKILVRMAKRGEDRGALEAAKELLQEGSELDAVVSALWSTAGAMTLSLPGGQLNCWFHLCGPAWPCLTTTPAIRSGTPWMGL
ncbi:MAG: hypothetical protein ACRDHL_12810 [Candidatus Promineifilaceae bacterium]